MAYPDTYYKRTVTDQTARPTLSGSVDCDVAIIGGGLAGLSAGLQLSRANKRVVILERESIGFGASGRNGGFVGPGYSTGIEDIARTTGRDAAHQLHRLSIEGVEIVRNNIETLGIDEAQAQSGYMSVRRFDDAASLKTRAEELRRDFGYELEFVGRESVRKVLHSSRYFQGLRDPNAFHIHPLNYLRGIAREIERLDGQIYEHSPVVSTKTSSPEKRLTTSGGMVTARDIIFATGGYTGSLNKRLQRAYLPIATFVMVSEEAPELIASAISTTDSIGDNRRAGDYYRLVEGGRRLLWGGRISTHEASVDGLVRQLRAEMIGAYPQLADLKTEVAWSGRMAYARHLMPQIGRMEPGVWHCTAFGGHGLNTTAIGGKVVAEGILGESDRYKLFEPFGLVWAGGLVGLAAAQLTYWKLQAQDRWQERRA